MKKMNRKGFTLIELLAVIVIMGILMLVAIPAVQRYINNAKKDTYVNTVKEYYNAARTAYAAGQIDCANASVCYITFAEIKANFLDSGGDSPYGGTFVANSRVVFNIASDGTVTYTVAASADNRYVSGDPTTFTKNSVQAGSITSPSGTHATIK